MAKSLTLILALTVSAISARHVHPRPQHPHVERQAPGLASIQTVPNPTPTALSDIPSLAGEMESCLERIPQDLVAIIQAVEQRLGAVQSQIASLGNIVASTASVPAATPLPATAPAITPLPFTAPAVTPLVSSPALSSIAALSVSSPIPPNLAGVPSLSSIVVPSSLAVAPSISSIVVISSIPGAPSLPPISLPTLQSISSISPPTVSSRSLPALVLPSVSSVVVPSASLASVGAPSSVSLPSPLPTAPNLSPLSPADFTPSSIFITIDPGLCAPSDGLGPMTPCITSTGTRTTHITLTSITSQLVTFHIPIPVSPPAPTLSSVVAPSLAASPAVPTLATSVAAPVLPATAIPGLPSKVTPLSLTTVTDIPSVKPVSSPTSSSYMFDANARDNLAVYYGSSPYTWHGGLADVCNSNADIVILAFLHDFFSANGYPSIDFGWSSCSGRTTTQASIAPGLKDCTELGSQIKTCQSLGKKVLLSLGGYVANSSFTSDLEARNFAITLWDLFGAGVGEYDDLRPFGRDVIVDGFDFDNENGNTAHWDVFASALRALFKSDDSKTYYLSAAPQCPYPDASIPLYALQHADFVWVQFYNNPSCNLDSNGFQSSFIKWSQVLKNDTLSSSPKLFIGAPAFAGAGSGYVQSSALSSRISLARELFTSNLGGIMLWDGAEGLKNVDQYGNTFLQYSKWALEY